MPHPFCLRIAFSIPVLLGALLAGCSRQGPAAEPPARQEPAPETLSLEPVPLTEPAPEAVATAAGPVEPPAARVEPAMPEPAKLPPAAASAPSPLPKLPPARAALPDTVAPAVTIESPQGTGRFGVEPEPVTLVAVPARQAEAGSARTAAAAPPQAPAPPAEAAPAAAPPAETGPPPEVSPKSLPRGSGPVVTVQAPEAGLFYGARLTLEGTVADSAEAGESAADIASLRYEISGEPRLAGEVAFDVWGGFLLNLDTSRLTGSRTLGVSAADRHGRTAERRLSIHDGRLPPRLSLRFPGQDSKYGARLLVSGRVEDPYAGLRPGGGIDALTLEIVSAEYRADSRPTRLTLNPDPEGAFQAVLSTGEWTGPQNLTVGARGWNRTQADLSVRLLPGDSDIPTFAAVSGDGQVMLSWEPVPLANAYSVFYREGGEAGAAEWRRLDRVQSPYNLRNLANGHLYSFRLVALSSEAPELSSATLPGIPLAPQTLQPTVTGEYQQLRLAWREIPGASAYEIWRKDGEDGTFRRLEKVSTESVYVDRDVRYGTTYYYQIRPDGVGSLSAPGSGRTEALPVRKVELAAAIPAAMAQGIAVGWSYAWVAAGGDGLKVYDIHDPASPQLVATLSTHDARAVAIQGDRVYIADGESGLKIADASEPLRPALLGSRTTEEASDVVVRGNYAYVADGAKGMRVIDVSDPRQPVRVASFDCRDARAVAAHGERILVADRQVGLFILDVRSPEKPALLGSLPTEDARDVAVVADLAFVADGAKGLKIVDIADPLQPHLVGSYDTTEARAVAVAGGYAYLADGAAGLRIIDVSDPRRPVQFAVEQYPSTGAVSVLEDLVFLGHREGLSVLHVLLQGKSFEVGAADIAGKAFGICVAGDLAFVAGHEDGVSVADVANPASLGGRKPLASWKGGYVEAVSVSGGLALAAAQDKGLVVLGVPPPAGSSPWEPLSVVPLAGRATGIAADGRYCCLTVEGVGLEIFDLQESRAPRLVGSFAAPSLRDVCLRGSRAYVAGDRWGLGIVDLSDPTAPVLQARLESCAASKVVVQGERLYVVTADGIRAFDVSEPGSPRELFLYKSPHAENLEVRGSYLYVAEGFRGLKVIDCRNPDSLRVVSACDSMYAVDVAVRGDYALVVDSVRLKAVQVLIPEWLR